MAAGVGDVVTTPASPVSPVSPVNGASATELLGVTVATSPPPSWVLSDKMDGLQFEFRTILISNMVLMVPSYSRYLVVFNGI